MLAVYGVDVLDPSVTLRRIWVLGRRLPAGSWPEEHSPMSWSVEAHLLASVLDALAALTFITIKAAGGKPTKPTAFPRPKPKRTPPPEAPRKTWAPGFPSSASSRRKSRCGATWHQWPGF